MEEVRGDLKKKMQDEELYDFYSSHGIIRAPNE
jgi:hypothetical protein